VGHCSALLLRDRDASYGSEFCDRVEAMGITEVITAPRSPWQNAYVERLIGSIRRECLDHFVIFNERHLRRVLSSYIDYYHRSRTHLSLDQDCPDPRPTSDAEAERSSPSGKSPACITATNVSPPDSPRIPGHQWLRGCHYAGEGAYLFDARVVAQSDCVPASGEVFGRPQTSNPAGPRSHRQ